MFRVSCSMQLSLNWLKDFVDIPKSISPEELGLRLTMHTVEIDSVEKQANKFANIVVGKILEIKKHPNADRLQLVKVDVGGKILEVICGAPNIEADQLVPVALIGAVLPNGMEIKEVEVRGVKSFGMLCAEDELGLGDDHSGIMILEKRAKIGQNLAEYLGLKDVIFEVDNKSITHRPDLWSHYGIAREIAAFLGVKFKEYKPDKKVLIGTNDIRLDVKVESFELCPRYMAVMMEGVKVDVSPKWMQERLIAAGMRPINNIVDVTNYVMLELGQPLHAFDQNLVDKIIVRKAKKNEVIETLDGERRELDNNILVIADSKKPVAIAGVIGGANSEINDQTSSIIIESANFDFISIRKTAQKLGLRTESSMRFEKALDPNLCELAIARTVELVKKLCPKAKIVSNLIDEKKFNVGQAGQGSINLDLNWLNKIVGQEIETKQTVKILTSLGFEARQSKDKLKVMVPTWRATRDISIPEDLVEEVARIFGYNNLQPIMPCVAMAVPEINQERVLERKVKNILSGGVALTEAYNYSFVGEKQLEKLAIDFSSHIRLVNPITANQTMLRQSLAPNLIGNIKTNQSRFESIGLFEIGSVYLNTPGEINKGNKSDDTLPYQEKRLGIILAASGKINVFSRIKGIAEYLLSVLDLIADFKTIETRPNWSDREMSAAISIGGKDIGLVAKLDNNIANKLGIKKEAAIIEISFGELYNLVRKQSVKKYQEHDKYPPVIRDLAFVVNEKILYNDIRDEMINFNELIKDVELFDVYQGGKLGAGKKNLAFHITYQAANKTLTTAEVDKLQQKLIKHLEKEFEARIRDF